MPTAVPLAADSLTLFAEALLSEIAPTLLSEVSSVRLIVNDWVEVEPSSEVALTVTVCEVAVSKSSRLLSATVTTPVLASIEKRPPASSSRL